MSSSWILRRVDGRQTAVCLDGVQQPKGLSPDQALGIGTQAHLYYNFSNIASVAGFSHTVSDYYAIEDLR